MIKQCFFIGYSATPEAVRPLLIESIKKHIIEYGVTEFIVGRHGGFCAMASNILGEVKKEFPHIKNRLALTQAPIEPIPLPAGFEDSFYPEELELYPMRKAVPSLDRIMLRQVGYLIAYSDGNAPDSPHRFMQYAIELQKNKQLVITNLAELLVL